MALEVKKKNLPRLLMADEKETRRIAREFHHNLPNSLLMLKLDLEKAIHQIGGNQIKSGIESLENLSVKIQQVSSRFQKIGMHLWPPTLDDLGILATVSWLCREFQDIHPGIQISIRMDIQEHDIPDFLKYAIYKILREALENAAIHSKADLVDLFLSERKATIELTIRDNGRGFDMEREAMMDSGVPVSFDGMRQRTEISGGCFTIESVHGKGTIIHATWPSG